MTCIVGFTEGGVTWLGGDSLGSNGYSGQVYKNKKVFKAKDSNDIVVGYTSSFRMGQILQYSTGLFDELSILKDKIDEEYMVTKFIPNLQRAFSDGGFEKNKSGQKDGGNFIIAIKDKLYEVQGEYSILEPKNGFCAVGSGEDFAVASLYATKDIDMTPIERITKALETAEHYSVGVQRPFYIINTENDEVIEIS